LSSESSALFLAEAAMELNVPIGLPFPLWNMTWNNKSECQFLGGHVHGVIYQVPCCSTFLVEACINVIDQWKLEHHSVNPDQVPFASIRLNYYVKSGEIDGVTVLANIILEGGNITVQVRNNTSQFLPHFHQVVINAELQGCI
jgi:hypothetical protein